MKTKQLTRQRLEECLQYDTSSGQITWKIRRSNTVAEGSIAGTIVTHHSGKSYRHIAIDGVIYQAHRLAWWLHYGVDAGDKEIDHINGDGLDNRIANLRVVSRAQNMRNKRRIKTNTSGVTGVSWHAGDRLWHASVQVDGKKIWIGSSQTFEKAVEMRAKANATLGFHSNHGADRPL